MQTDRAEELQEKWLKRGSPQCSHEHIEKEYYLGSDTGDYVCTTCGASGCGKNWNKKP